MEQSLLGMASRTTAVGSRFIAVLVLGASGATLESVGVHDGIIVAVIASLAAIFTLLALHRTGRSTRIDDAVPASIEYANSESKDEAVPVGRASNV